MSWYMLRQKSVREMNRVGKLGLLLFFLLPPLFLLPTSANGASPGKQTTSSHSWNHRSRFFWAKQKGLETRILWVDALANYANLTSREKVQTLLNKAVEAGFNAIGVGVKTPEGYVLYPSRIAPVLPEPPYNQGYDLLKIFIEEASQRGLEVYALVMIFSEGRISNRRGPGFSRFPQWQVKAYLPAKKGGKILPQSQAQVGTFLFVNPVLEEVQNYERSLLKELITRYDVDGIVLDRCRYPALWADFSETSRRQFEKVLGKSVRRWPEDIFEYHPGGVRPGPLYSRWLSWRAEVIGNFVRKTAGTLRKLKPGVKVGVVVGSWYPDYINEGVNWGSLGFDAGKEFAWAGRQYRKAGFAEALDFLVANCYGRFLEREEAIKAGLSEWYSVEGAATMARMVVANACWVYGGIYTLLYQSHPQDFDKAVQIVQALTNGIAVFDVSYIEKYNWWDRLKEAFQQARKPAHSPIADLPTPSEKVF